MIPQELQDQPIWSPSMTKKGKEKAPLHDVDKHHQHTKYGEAYAQHLSLGEGSKHLGIMSSFENDLIVLDYDIKQDEEGMHKELSNDFLNFLRKHPTYTEWSPSGKGLHVIYRLDSRDVEALRGAKLKRKTQRDVNGTKGFTGEVFFGAGFVIITGTLMDPTLCDINTISLSDLAGPIPDLTTWTRPRPRGEVRDINTGLTLAKDPTFDRDETEAYLMSIPGRMNFYLNKAYERLNFPMTPNNYEHWINIGMSLAHAAIISGNPATEADCLTLFNIWSEADTESYVDYDDVVDKWEAIMATTRDKVEANDPEVISRNFLFKLASDMRPKYLKKPNAKKDLVPIWEHTENLLRAFEHHGLDFYADINDLEGLFVKCHPDVVSYIFGDIRGVFRYFEANDGDVMVSHSSSDILIRRIFEMSGYPVKVIGSIIPSARSLAASKIDFENLVNVYDRFKAYIDKAPWDGKSRVDAFIKTLKFKDTTTDDYIEHNRIVVRKCLLWMVGSRFHHEASAVPCIPILVGAEATHKTTWIQGILRSTPFAETNYMRMNEQIGDRKELARSFVKTIVGALEEIETALKNPSAEKAFLTDGSISIRPHYKNAPVNTRRNTLLIGTSNDLKMLTSKHGNRRFLRMNIAYCDTANQLGVIKANVTDPEEIAKIHSEKQQLFAELKAEYYQKMSEAKTAFDLPWVLTKEENRRNNVTCEQAATQSNDEILVEEYFGGKPSDFEFDPEVLCGIRGGMKQNVDLIKEGHAISAKRFYITICRYQQRRADGTINFKVPNANAVRYKLEEFATKYTKSGHTAIRIGKSKEVLSDGFMKLKGQTLFIIPQRRKDDDDDDDYNY